MGLLAGLYAYLRNASRKLVQAMFGWAVQALFGHPKESEKTFLSVVVGGAAIWPLLPIGILFPKVAVFLLTFVPIPKWVPSSWIRLAWAAAILLVPAAVGLTLARRGSGESGPFWRRALQGVPVTIALAAGFAVAFFTSAIRRVLALGRRWEDEHVPLLIEREDYEAVAEEIRTALAAGGLELEHSDPPRLLVAPSRVVRALGGKALRNRIPKTLDFYAGEDLEVAVHPNGVTIQGESKQAARAHSLISEKGTVTSALQTTEPAAQDLERRLKDVWRVYARDPDSHSGSAVLRQRLESLSTELSQTFLPFEQWQILYREILQVSRGIGGRAQLVTEWRASKTAQGEVKKVPTRDTHSSIQGPPRPGVRSLSSLQLVQGIRSEMRELIEKQTELARVELKSNLKAQLGMIRWVGVAAVVAVCFVDLLFVAGALALGRVLAPWLAALAVAAVLLLLAVGLAVVGWSKRVKPLETTRKTLKENWEWTKNRIA